jgi:hypothetical protein
MSTNLLSAIKKVGVIDDYEDGRDTLAYMVEDASLEPVFQNDSVTDLESYLESINEKFDAVVTDHHLRKVKSYFPIDGAEFAAHCYHRRIPSLLVTRYEQPEILEIRKFREKLPVVLTPDEYNVDSLIEGLEKCMNEFAGNISVGRKAWRTLVRIDDIKDNKNVYLVIPGWNSQQAIALNMNNLPDHLQKVVKPDMRLFAKVNIGNENANELFIKDWEI